MASKDEAQGEGEGERAPARSYAVGYGRPPVEHQFKSRQSGNPAGRPKGAKGLKADIKAEMGERVIITLENGKKRRVRKQQLIIKALAMQAAKGNVAAADKLLGLIIQTQGIEDERPRKAALSANDQQILDYALSLGSAPAEPADSPDAATDAQEARAGEPDEGMGKGKGGIDHG